MTTNVLLLRYCILVAVVWVAGTDDQLSDNTVMSNVALVLQRTVLFYKMSYSHINLDGILGFRIAEGIFEQLISHEKLIPKFSAVYISSKRILTVLQDINTRAINKMEEENSSYYRTFKQLLQQPWFFQAPLKKYNENLVRDISIDEEEFNEETSDHCLSELFMSHDHDDKSKCTISSKCWKGVTMKGTGGYYLTHQALYFIIANLIGCSRVSSMSIMNVDDLYTDLGSNIYSQMKSNMINSFTEQDLFLEQGLLCNMLGIDVCNRIDWIIESLRWQDESGCVKEQSYDLLPGTSEKHASPLRRLQVDAVFEDGCSSHATGLYMAYLAFCWHWFLTKDDANLKVALMFNRNIYFVAIIIIMTILITIFLRCVKNRKFRSRIQLLHIF